MSPLANAARGEVALLIDGAPVKLCLTLGALADLEAAFDAQSLADLADRLAGLGPSDLLVIVSALAGGGGEPRTPAELARARIDPKQAAEAVAACFRLAFDA